MTAPDLAGLGVAVTRPAPLGEPLARRIEAAGGHALRFPAIEIGPPPDPRALAKALAGLAAARLAVFASPTAVREALARLPAGFRPPAGLEVAALGPGTARALAAAGWPVHHLPAGGQDSEALLALPALARPRGWDVVILAGAGGRPLLAETLRARGARVTVAACFRRQAPAGDAGALLEAIDTGRVQVVAVTSGEAMANLLAMAGGGGVLARAAWLTGHPRVAAAGRDQGIVGEWILARGMDDEAMFAALAAWWRGRRP